LADLKKDLLPACPSSKLSSSMLTSKSHKKTSLSPPKYARLHDAKFRESFLLDLKNALKMKMIARCLWLTPTILATQEAEIKWIVVQSQPQTNSS
jgi:hypothetical protein